MSEKSTRAIPAELIMRSPIETLEARTLSGRIGGEPRMLYFRPQRIVRVEGFDFLDCDAGVLVNDIRVVRHSGEEVPVLVSAPVSLCAIDTRIYGPWRTPGLAPGDVLQIELDGEGRYAMILRTVEVD